mmetsp:Transcript_35575/g.48040  ORF Transcript_35575/g.48040 Transcript_35575/m.48040 type:complete len:80 (+) Transcript_35575:137-376(+)
MVIGEIKHGPWDRLQNPRGEQGGSIGPCRSSCEEAGVFSGQKAELRGLNFEACCGYDRGAAEAILFILKITSPDWYFSI